MEGWLVVGPGDEKKGDRWIEQQKKKKRGQERERGRTSQQDANDVNRLAQVLAGQDWTAERLSSRRHVTVPYLSS